MRRLNSERRESEPADDHRLFFGLLFPGVRDVRQLHPEVAGVGRAQQPGRQGDDAAANQLLDLAVEALHPFQLAVPHRIEQGLAVDITRPR